MQMATEITYDPTEANVPEFSEADQEAIQIGQQLEDAQSEMLAGKYRNAEELESAYIELQQRFSSGDREAPAEEQVTDEEEYADEEVNDVSDIDTSFLENLYNESFDEFSNETLETLDNMSSNEVADMFLAYRQQNADAELQEQDIVQLKNIVGGEQEYDSMVTWAQTALGEQEINMYDSVMQKGDPAACFFAVQALKGIYSEATGFEGQMFGGSESPDMVDAYRSQAEMIRDMSDPRYDTDPAFREDIMAKLSRSNENIF